ncbi:MAG TPA: enoyl-CoA hydratase/isomerase family protein [Solimonas sp.]|nr:enoyl-CoA hydratase/isomerase family protein [Solimonas sp.]
MALLTLNRANQRNCLHPDLIAELSEQLKSLRERDDVKVIVITANGLAFCAGLDLAHLRTLAADDRVTYMRSAFALFELLHEQPQPTIAAINGPAVAGGFDLAVFCDLRLSVPTARFAQPEIILGVTQFFYPAWTLVGLARAKELALTGLPVSAEEAWRIGLVNHLVSAEELLPRTMTLARTIASRPREALLETKRLSRELPGQEKAAAFTMMGEALDRSLRSEAHRRALDAYLQAGLKG